MPNPQGKPLSSDTKKVIVQLKSYFDSNKRIFQTQDSSAQMVANALDIGLASVNRVMANYNKDPKSLDAVPKPKGRPEHSVSVSHQELVRSYVRSANLEGKHVTLEMIKDLILSESDQTGEFHIMSLSRALDRWGFEFGKGIRTQNLKEKDYIVAHRHRYLRRMRENRRSTGEIIHPEVYLDESYVNKNHSNDFIWHSSEDGSLVQKPTGNGERFVIVNAITQTGWVPNAKLVFKSTRKTGDYHGQMNGELFQKWFTEKLLPNIPENSLIIMDNASYHSILSEASAPTLTCSKEKIFKWLQQNKIACNPDCLRAELLEILSKLAPEPTYIIDELARKNGHEVVRTPPYHPELQPIEICWGVVKNEIARHCDFTMRNLGVQLEKAFEKVTELTCKKIIKQVREIEEKFWREDALLENQTGM
jgi:transposase